LWIPAFQPTCAPAHKPTQASAGTACIKPAFQPALKKPIFATLKSPMDPLKIIFMGTPEFAVPTLEILVQNNFDVIAVITAPDKPQGRGQKVVFSAVKACALQHRIPVLQPTNLKAPEFIEQLKSFQADLQIVVAFRMLPEVVWSMPRYGTFNLHASLLPQYRGAAPINWAIIKGEKETGVTTFFLKHDIDTGSIIFQDKESIHEDDNAGSLYERLMKKGAALVLKTVQAIQTGNYPTVAQVESIKTKHAPKIFRETCEIQWNNTSKQIRNFVRGLSPYPGAWTTLNGKNFKIFSTSIVDKNATAQEPGEVISDNKNYLYVKTKDGWISIDELQPEGKKKMTIQDFFRGNKL
jgi:methionyl-tRNA formyltransferase